MSVAIRPFEDPDEQQVVALWHSCGRVRPWNDPHRDIARKRLVQPELFLVAHDGAVAATAMAGYDGHRGSIYYVAVRPALQGSGLGRRMMAEAEARLEALGCPKVNVLVRAGNEEVGAFYDRLGYVPDAVAGFGKRLIADA